MKTVTANFTKETETITADNKVALEAEDKYVGGTYVSFEKDDIKALVEDEGNLISATFVIEYTCELNANALTE